MLEHVTHQITIEALPDRRSRRASRPTSPGWTIGDTLQLSAISAPAGRRVRPRRGGRRGRGHDRDALAAPGRGGARAGGRGGGRAGRRGGRGARGRGGSAEGEGGPEGEAAPATAATPARGSSALCRCSTGSAALEARARPDPRRRRPRPGRRARETRRLATRGPATTSASRSPLSSRARWELPRARKRYRGLITEGRAGPGGPRVAVLLPQTFMNESGTLGGPGPRLAQGPARAGGRAPRRDRPAVRRGARPSSAAGSPATTG